MHMRFLALQTDVNVLKKQFILQDEQEILTTTHHPFVFLFPAFGTTLIALPLIALIGYAFVAAPSTNLELLTGITLLIAMLVYGYLLFKWYIDWCYNFLIVTTDKIIVITHMSIFYQHVNPIHLDNLMSVKCESRFLGVWHCGLLHITLREKQKGGPNVDVVVHYIHKPETIASAIEHGMSLLQQKSQIHADDQKSQQVEEIQQKVDGAAPEVTTPISKPPEVA